MAGMNDAIAMALMQAGQMVPRTQRDPYAERKKAAMASLLQGMRSDPVQGGIGEGIARALTAGVGGYFLGKANQDQADEDAGRRSALVAALTPDRGPDGKPVPLDLTKAARALVNIPGMEGMGTSLIFANMADDRNRAQTADTARIITGQPLPGLPGVGGAPQAGGGAPTSYYGGISFDESGNNPQARHPLGGAGQYGFMPQTWDGARAAIPGLPAHPTQATPDQQLAAAQWVTRQNAAVMEKMLGRAPTGGELRLAHFFGGAGASRLLGLDPNMTFDQVPDGTLGMPTRTVIEANPQLRGMTIGSLLKDYRGRYDQFNPLGGGQPQAAPPARVAGPPMAPPAQPVAVPPQSVGPIPMQFGGRPQTAAVPPVDGGGIPDDSGGEPPNPGFGSPTVKLPPPVRFDDGSQEMAIYNRAINSPNLTPAQMEMALKYYQIANEKRLKAQQAQADAASKEPPMMARTDAGGVAMVDGALEAIRAKAAAGAAGSGAVEYFIGPDGQRYERNRATGVEKPAPQADVTTTVTGAGGYPVQRDQSGKETPVPGPTALFNEAQGKAAGFADRMRRAAGILDQVESSGLDASGRLLEGLGIAGNYLQDPKYRQYMQARDDMIAAQLRRESGAVIADKELEDAYRRYMPRPGDDPATLAQKRAARATLVEGMIRDAGPAYKPTDPAPRDGGSDTLQQARNAIKAGAPRDKVIERLKSMGIDPGGL